MKTVLEIAKACGADIGTWDKSGNGITLVSFTEAQLSEFSEQIRALIDQPVKSLNINEIVNRFLGWKLPSDFSPDCGISFEQYSNPNNDRYKALREPTGTNLFNADQAKAMFQHVLKGATTELVEQPAQSQELENVAKISDKELLEFGISEELLLFANESDYLAIAQGVLELVQFRLNQALQSKPAKG